jgi:PAS domain S-box-containing protein
MSPTFSPPAGTASRFVRSLIEAHVDPFFILGLTGTISDVNRAAEVVTGLARERLIGTPFAGYFADPEAAKVDLESVLRGGSIRDRPFVLRHSAGSLIELECSATVHRGDAGEILGVFVTGRDVSESKKARDEQALLAAIVTSSSDAIVTKDLTGTMTSWNQAAEMLYGFSAAEMIGRNVSVLAPRGLEDEAAELTRRVLEGKRVSEHVTRRLRKDGSVVEVALTMAPVCDRDGRILAISVISHDVGPRRRAQGELVLSEAKFSAAFHASPDLIAITRLSDGAILEVNEAYSELLGHSREESLGRTTSELAIWAVPEDRKALTEALAAAGRVDDFEITLRRKDGSLVVCLDSARPLEVAGEPCMLSVAHDITDRKRMEEEHLARARFAETLESVNHVIVAAEDLKGMLRQVLEIVFTALACDRVWLLRPCDPEAATFCVPMEVARPEYPGTGTAGGEVPMPADLAANLREALSVDGPISFVGDGPRPVNCSSAERVGVRSMMLMALRTRMGESWAFGVHQCSHARVWSDEELQLFAAIGSRLTDALTSLTAVEELRRSEARYRRIVDTAAEGIWTLDLEGRTTFVNAAMAEMLGRTVQDMLGCHASDFMFAGDVADHVERLRVRGRGVIERYERRLRREDGTELWTSVSGTPLLDERGEALGSMAMLTDVTERRRAQQEVLELNARLEGTVAHRTRDLEAACRELEAFSYSVSHDLRTPLRAIDGFSQALVEDCGDAVGEEGVDHLARVRKAAQHMGEMIDALLGLSRISQRELVITAVDLTALAWDIASQLQAADPRRVVRLQIADGLVADGDRALLEVVLGNLLGNAWKYTAKREVAHIEVGTVDDLGVTAFFVRDDGAGFDSGHADQLFEPFRRLCDEADFAGSGIGLATVQRVVRRHGGRCWAEGEPGKGATFFFTLNPNAG